MSVESKELSGKSLSYLVLVFLYDHLSVKLKQKVVRGRDITVNEHGVFVKKRVYACTPLPTAFRLRGLCSVYLNLRRVRTRLGLRRWMWKIS